MQAAAGDVGDAVHDVLHAVVRQHLSHRADVDLRRRQQRLAHRLAKLLDVIGHLRPGDVEDDLPGQAEAVRVQPGRGHADHQVVGLDRPAVDHPLFLGHADAEAGQVVIAGGVDVGQDGRLAAQQGAVGLDAAGGDALDDLLQQGRIVLGHGHVVEEEQRLGPAAQGVVDAHRHQVDADRVVPADRHGHLELRAHAVGAGDQHRVLVVPGEELVGEIELEEAGEPAFQGDHPRRVGPRQQPRQPGHGLSVDVQIDAGVFVGRFGHVAVVPSPRIGAL